MLIPANRLLAALASEFAKLTPLIPDSGTDGSAAQGIANAILLLGNREAGGAAFVDAQLDGFAMLLKSIEPLAGAGHATGVAQLQTRIASARASSDFVAKEAEWRALLGVSQTLATAIAGDGAIAADQRRAVMAALVKWEAADRQAQVAPPAASEARDQMVNAERLAAYLRDRFGEPALEVTSFKPLAGGFGKETYLFSASGKALSGGFVMRRDLAGGSSLDLGCHRVAKEYHVVKAAFDLGFPAPDALWMDDVHPLLPGGDFTIMRQSPGTIGGNFFGAQTDIPVGLVDSLASIMARLHALPPMTALGDLTNSIRGDLWPQSRKAATCNYITGWRDYFLSHNHTPSPALMALFGWLIDNVPDQPGPAVLVHGDIGFHNFLFHEGQLSAVLDWEFAHIGDPAEELAYVRETIGKAIDWERFAGNYVAAGGEAVDDATLRYYRVWAHVRNAAGSNLIAANFIAGLADDLKLAFLPHIHFPMFITAAQALIEEA